MNLFLFSTSLYPWAPPGDPRVNYFFQAHQFAEPPTSVKKGTRSKGEIFTPNHVIIQKVENYESTPKLSCPFDLRLELRYQIFLLPLQLLRQDKLITSQPSQQFFFSCTCTATKSTNYKKNVKKYVRCLTCLPGFLLPSIPFSLSTPLFWFGLKETPCTVI